MDSSRVSPPTLPSLTVRDERGVQSTSRSVIGLFAKVASFGGGFSYVVLSLVTGYTNSVHTGQTARRW